jgi:hypothetical protein
MVELIKSKEVPVGVHVVGEDMRNARYTPKIFPVNKLSSLSELIDKHEYTLFTPIALYVCFENVKLPYDPFYALVSEKLWKHIQITSELPFPLFRGLWGKWEPWARRLYMIPKDKYYALYADLAGNGFFNEILKKIFYITMNYINVVDGIKVVNGLPSDQVVVHAVGFNTSMRAVRIENQAKEGDPALVTLNPDPYIENLERSLLSGDYDPIRTAKRKTEQQILQQQQPERKIKSLDDIPLRKFSDLKPSLRKKLQNLTDTYNSLMLDIVPATVNTDE